MALFLTALFLLACGVSAGSCVSKPCGTDYQVSYWNPLVENGQLVFYYEVEADGCNVFTDVLLLLWENKPCKNCATVKCYDKDWDEIKCKYPASWVTSDQFFSSKGVSPTYGLKWVLPSSTALRFSITVAKGTPYQKTNLLTKGNSWSKCQVIGPICDCNPTCPPCPRSCYKPNPNTCGCSNCTDCLNNYYEVSPCNTTSNRVCQPCQECVTGSTYQTVPCNQTQNRVCQDCTQCVTNMTYEVRPCNKTSNRLCQNCTQCVANMTYQVRPCNTTHNRVCQNCTQCVANMTYQVRPCNTTHNRVCENCTQCVANMTYQVRPCNTTHNRVCENCTQCVTNMTYQVRPCNTTHNRVCQNCTVCVPGGSYETRPCNQTIDRLCEPCRVCVDNVTYETVPCSTTTNRVCTNCTQCVTNMTYEVAPCNRTSNRVCRDCNVCVTNQTYETAPCTPTSNRICNNCTTCIPGETYEAQTCNVTHDRVCTACSNCTDGFFEVSPCNATHDRVCQQCSNCTANEQVAFPCNATHDVVCEPCPECANCTDPNSHLDNNGLSCTCNDGYTQDPASEDLHCVPVPCCANCMACGFNSSFPCVPEAHEPTLCNFSCKLADQCIATTPFDTNYTVTYLGRTEDDACCGSGSGECTCFRYALAAAGIYPLNDFILGLTCDSLAQCDVGVPTPCFDSVIADGGVDQPFPFITDVNNRDPYTDLWGIVLTGLNLQNSGGTYDFVFQGHINESSIPLPFSAGAQASASSEDRTCLIDSIVGPACVDCSRNPDAALQSMKKHLMGFKHSEKISLDTNAGNANGNVIVFIALTILNIVAMVMRN